MATRTPYVQKPGRVFVGNIPMFATEEELASACSVFGPVVFFNLVIDKNTGKHKGYGFCEFRDEETALSAHRNQKGLLCQGRQLRVGMAHSAEERRKMLANKNIKVPATTNIKEQKIERELDVFALRQLMKLRQAMAAKSNPKKRENPSTVAAGPSKKPNMSTEDCLRQGSYIVRPTTAVLEYNAPAGTKSEGQTGHDMRTTSKENPCTGCGTDELANHKALPPGSCMKKELDNAVASSTTSRLLDIDYNLQPICIHEDLIALLHLLKGDTSTTSTSRHHHQYIGEKAAIVSVHPKHSLQVASTA